MVTFCLGHSSYKSRKNCFRPCFRETIGNDLGKRALALKGVKFSYLEKSGNVEMFSHILLNPDLLRNEYSSEMMVEFIGG